MQRTLISKTPAKIGKQVKICGWVSVRRDHGKIIFLDIRDRSGLVQTVFSLQEDQAYQVAKEARSEFAVILEGKVKERLGKGGEKKKGLGGVEIEAQKLEILSRTEEELPFDVSKKELDLNIQTLLDHRNLSLRHKKINDIFKVYSEILKSYAGTMRADGFLEIKTPKILSAASEGGANFFKIKYFKREAYLAQSPQFYKQAGVGAFERVFEIGSVFRAEPHFTTRHVNEYVGLDAEMGFIADFSDIMDQLERVMKKMIKDVRENCADILEEYGSGEILSTKDFPRLKLSEALEILKKEYGKETEGFDIDPEGERLICKWAQKKYGSDFVFLTHYPVSGRPFYTMPDPRDSKVTVSFDLLFRGVEIATGGQRIHLYENLVESIQRHKLNPEDFKGYLSVFKLGMPPHGGWGMGSERIAQKILGLGSVKEAILFPRDVKRLAP